MEKNILRSKLHEYIDSAEENKLQAIYTLVEEEIEHYVFSQEEIAELHERRKNHLSGSSKSYSVEESLDKIKRNSL